MIFTRTDWAILIYLACCAPVCYAIWRHDRKALDKLPPEELDNED